MSHQKNFDNYFFFILPTKGEAKLTEWIINSELFIQPH